jgi:hypothetical protein
MADINMGIIGKIGGLEGLIYFGSLLGIPGNVTIGLLKDGITTAARSANRHPHILRYGEIARTDRITDNLLGGHIHRGAAAIPIFDFMQADSQRLENGSNGFIIGAGRVLQAATGVISIL